MAKNVPIARSVAALRHAVARYRAAGETVALVPTMGALHAGHLALVRRARRHHRRVVVSIFVNPAQFAPNEDFSTYPRTFDADVAALTSEGADLVWAPASAAEMYPPGFSTRIAPAGPAVVGLEDRFRPHFFGGVATVVAKLLLQCLPDIALFGEKDFQQLRVIQRMAADLDIPAKIVGVPTIREKDGLALSSRNVYLSPAARSAAPALYAALTSCAEAIAAGCDPGSAVALATETAAKAGFRLDYLEARHAETLEPLAAIGNLPVRLLAAGWLGKTRLIDNVAVPAS